MMLHIYRIGISALLFAFSAGTVSACRLAHEPALQTGESATVHTSPGRLEDEQAEQMQFELDMEEEMFDEASLPGSSSNRKFLNLPEKEIQEIKEILDKAESAKQEYDAGLDLAERVELAAKNVSEAHRKEHFVTAGHTIRKSDSA